jgi:hypothetical protein
MFNIENQASHSTINSQGNLFHYSTQHKENIPLLYSQFLGDILPYSSLQCGKKEPNPMYDFLEFPARTILGSQAFKE